jgi:putative nucleotidyltransferase with HDIG domain
MSAKVLKLVNSAYYGLPQRVASPALAVSLLGTDIIKSMILLIDIFAQFDRISALAPQFNFQNMQRHSLAVGGYARAIAHIERAEQSVMDSYFMAGLFHDIGKLILIANLPQQYNAAIQLSAEQGITISAAELAVFGATHAEVGAYLLGLWGFSDAIVEACAYHHQPAQAQERGIVSVIYVANVYDQVGDALLTAEELPDLDADYLAEIGVLGRLPSWVEACARLKDEGDETWR